jgi:hypothetical protein
MRISLSYFGRKCAKAGRQLRASKGGMGLKSGRLQFEAWIPSGNNLYSSLIGPPSWIGAVREKEDDRDVQTTERNIWNLSFNSRMGGFRPLGR